jgi:hypothetical protein
VPSMVRLRLLRRDCIRFSCLKAKAGGKGIRTPGLLIANETLYQLSYTPEIVEKPPLNVQNFVWISTEAPLVLPPEDFRRVHFCPDNDDMDFASPRPNRLAQFTPIFINQGNRHFDRSAMTPLLSAHLFAAFFGGLPSREQEIDDKLPSNSG